jgi:hypothetical protein
MNLRAVKEPEVLGQDSQQEARDAQVDHAKEERRTRHTPIHRPLPRLAETVEHFFHRNLLVRWHFLHGNLPGRGHAHTVSLRFPMVFGFVGKKRSWAS